ncbi:hypothetical protein OAV71_04470 [Opitutales bacterium]|nr:hypothetical protein [Opitutales bacterium]
MGTAEDDQVASDIIFATANGNSFSSDPKLAVIGTVGGTGILATSAQPQASSPAKTGAATFSGLQTSFLTQTTYRGAFDGFTDWAESWTKVDSSDYLATLSSDLDSDGLILAQEITTNQNTDPSKSDTDGDGISDLTDPNSNVVQIAKQIGLSSRGFCGSLSTDPLIAGFFISGTTPKSVIVTAKGPSLPQSEVANPLADPQLYIVSGTTGAVVGGPINNWQDSADAAAIADSGRAPSSNLDSAVILRDLAPGPYSAICYGENITGTALIEVYEFDDGGTEDAKFDGLSTRGYCGALTNDPRIVGFFVGGDPGTTVDLYVGAKGPSLPSSEVSNPISDPAVYIVSGTTGAVVAGPIDNWQDGADASHLNSIGRAPTDPKDAALILRDLPPGPYSAIAYGTGDVTGTVLVEVYEVDLD